MAASERNAQWTREQLQLAFYLYCQLPFGKLDHRNQKVIALASLIGRTPSALAMKLGNFASPDPSITSTGRVGLKGASRLDRAVWDEFHYQLTVLSGGPTADDHAFHEFHALRDATPEEVANTRVWGDLSPLLAAFRKASGH